MMKIITNLVIPIFGIFFGIACEQVQPLGNFEPTGTNTTLVGPDWQLVAFVEADGDHIPIDRNSNDIPKHAYTVVFSNQAMDCPPSFVPCGDRYMKATGYPNQGELSYNLDLSEEEGESLVIYVHAITEIGLPEGSKEPEFFDALKAVTHYRINGTQLRLFYGDGQKALLFEPLDSEEGFNDNRNE